MDLTLQPSHWEVADFSLKKHIANSMDVFQIERSHTTAKFYMQCGNHVNGGHVKGAKPACTLTLGSKNSYFPI